ncbi:MAG: Mov34/MPN/PAD-1 family protein [Cyclobacteriaceae bacterium]
MRISIYNWVKLVLGLRSRGQNIRESGAFLIGNSEKVDEIIFYDEIDPNVASTGIIHFDGKQRIKFEDRLQSAGKMILADFHTHPGNSSEQSRSDRENPMVRIKGHLAFIAPYYGHFPIYKPKACSAYYYQGNFEWKRLAGREFPLKVKLL